MLSRAKTIFASLQCT